jgi:tetratricopeptide (TPR) repeat protein
MNFANKSIKQNISAILSILVGFFAIFALSNFLSNSRPVLPESYIDEDLALQGAKIKGYTLGFEGLIADWYWMQSLQYIGDKLNKSNQQKINLEDLTNLNPRLLYPLLDNATTLDPQFLTAYSYGAVVLPAIDPEQAIKIAEKGIANNPNEWRFYHQLGYIYWRLGKFEKAAELYSNGGKISGAPSFMQMMAAQMKSQAGSRDTARAIYEQMYEEAQDNQTKEIYALRLLQIDSLDERDLIRGALQTFQAKNNRCAANWREIFPLLRTQKTQHGKTLRFDSATSAPVDPTNVPYVLQNSDKCDVDLNFETSKIPVR